MLIPVPVYYTWDIACQVRAVICILKFVLLMNDMTCGHRNDCHAAKKCMQKCMQLRSSTGVEWGGGSRVEGVEVWFLLEGRGQARSAGLGLVRLNNFS